MKSIYCNNCGKDGHYFNQCNNPIISFGIIVFRINKINEIEYLMIRRKETLGYNDFIRGKYNINNIEHIQNIVDEMTNDEKEKITDNSTIKNIELSIRNTLTRFDATEKYHKLLNGIYTSGKQVTLDAIIHNSKTKWKEQEWGFPKGRRNYKEDDMECAIREWEEETGYDRNDINIIININPLEEIFMGSNYKSYKHVYYIAKSGYIKQSTTYQKQEVSKIGWYNFEKSIKLIRPYNFEKIQLLKNINKLLKEYPLYTYG